MKKKMLMEKLSAAEMLLERVSDSTGHVGVALELTAYIQEYVTNAPGDAGDRLYEDPFFSFFQNASHDTHTQFPIRKMAMLSAIEGYRRYLGEETLVH